MEFYVFLNPIASKLNPKEHEWSGKIIEYSWKEETLKLKLKISDEIVIANFTNQSTDDWKEKIEVGQILQVQGEMKKSPKNTIPNTFSYQDYLKSNLIFYQIEIQNMKIIQENKIWDKIREQIREYCNKLENSFYLKKLILGIEEEQKNAEEAYRKNGISHIFAISGMHLGIVYAFGLKIGKKLKGKNKYIWSWILISIYYALIDQSTSAARAYCFLTIESWNKIIQKNLSKTQIFWLTICFNLWQNPYSLFQISFQYSYIISYVFLTYSQKKQHPIKALGTSSVFAFFFSLPITASCNYSINPWSILNNIILVPIALKILFPMLLLSFICPIFSGIPKSCFDFYEIINDNLSKLPYSEIIFPKASIFAWLVYYILLCGYMKSKRKWLLVFLFCFLFIGHNYPKWLQEGSVHFMDVGQGDSILVVAPFQKEVILIDTGKENLWQLKNQITFFHSLGISKIDILILTHGDFDHMGNAVNLIENFKVEKVILNCGDYNNLENKLIKILDKKNMKYDTCVKELNINNNKLYFLNTREYNNENDNSSVIYVELNHYKFLFMGDASTLTEKEILDKYHLPNIDVLKVGHHGSRTSSSKEFINTINPKYSLISVGKNNRYGHPNKEVVEILNKSKIYRTDEDGSIMFKTKSNKLEIATCSP